MGLYTCIALSAVIIWPGFGEGNVCFLRGKGIVTEKRLNSIPFEPLLTLYKLGCFTPDHSSGLAIILWKIIWKSNAKSKSVIGEFAIVYCFG